MTTSEAAKKLGVSVRRVQALIASGKLPAIKIGRDWHIADIRPAMTRKPGKPKKTS